MAYFNPEDKLILDVPLFIRMLEYAREDAKTDMDLHKVTENALLLSEKNKKLTMDDYDKIIKGKSNDITETIKLTHLCNEIIRNNQGK